MSHNAKAWKFKRALLQKEDPCRAKTLWNVKVLKGLLSDGTETPEGKVIFNFGIWWRHMKTENCCPRIILSLATPQSLGPNKSDKGGSGIPATHIRIEWLHSLTEIFTNTTRRSITARTAYRPSVRVLNFLKTTLKWLHQSRGCERIIWT